jgi:benzoyl-CoA reductase subunit A
MKTFVGIDLGSTTTKAVLLDEDRKVIGRGITNSRSNYATAARVAGEEAYVDGQFTLFRRALIDRRPRANRTRHVPRRAGASLSPRAVSRTARRSRADLRRPNQGERFAKVESGVKESLGEVFRRLREEAPRTLCSRRQAQIGLLPRHRRIALPYPCRGGRPRGERLPYDLLLNVYDKSIIEVENRPPSGELSDKFRGRWRVC